MEPSTRGSDPLFNAVSIIIPTHRRPAYLVAAIQSAARQSSPPLEIIVVDDGGDLPANFSAGEVPAGIDLSILSIAHGGQCGARKAGFEASRGGLILFLDDDDTLHADALAILQALHQREDDLVAAVGAAESVDADGAARGRVNRPRQEISSADLWTGNQVATAGCVLIRRWAYQAVGGWDISAPNAADYLLWMKMARVGRIAGTDEVVLDYRWHFGSESAMGHQFAQLRGFRNTFRRAFPELARSETEDTVVTSLITPYIHPAIRYWRELIRGRHWREALREGSHIVDGIAISIAGPNGRRAVKDALALWRPKWPHSSRKIA
jgi:glycosyltransferase involved in cell wall biosynthesis